MILQQEETSSQTQSTLHSLLLVIRIIWGRLPLQTVTLSDISRWLYDCRVGHVIALQHQLSDQSFQTNLIPTRNYDSDVEDNCLQVFYGYSYMTLRNAALCN